MKKIIKHLLLTFAGVLAVSLLFAQMDKSKRASPPETASGMAGGSTITINYSSPAVKGRKIWGGLVPYDKVWRTGLQILKDIHVGRRQVAGIEFMESIIIRGYAGTIRSIHTNFYVCPSKTRGIY